MRLSEFPAGRRGRTSEVDKLPDDVMKQLLEARSSGSHSVAAMAAWLQSEGFERVTASMLSNWFQARGYRHGVGRGDA